jgi:hypothetical protein
MTARKTHIIRLYKDDDPESDQWIDIERLDELYFESGRGPQYREKKWKFDWDNFDPDSKTVTKKQIVDPNDENNFIEVPVRNSVFVHEARGDQYYSYKKKFLNNDSNRRRETVSRQVFYHEIKEEYLEVNGQPPSDPDDYLASLGEQDMDQWVEVELLKQYWTDQKDNHDAQGKLRSASAWQAKKWLYNDDDVDPLLRDPMLETDEVDPDFVPKDNPTDGPIVDPPWRLDPLQNIVNISWGGGLAVEFFDGENGKPSEPPGSG